MPFYKHKKELQLGNQIIFKNTTHDAKFNPWKLYYGLIKVGEKLIPYEYEGKFRSEARVHFEEIARIQGGSLDTLGVYK